MSMYTVCMCVCARLEMGSYCKVMKLSRLDLSF